MKLIWPLLMIFSFGVLDMASTYMVYERLGTFAYETGVLPAAFYAIGGIGAVLGIKMTLTVVYAFTLYFIAGIIKQFDGICKLMCLGAAFVGLLASFSNLSGAFTGSTIFVLGIGIDGIAYLTFGIFFAAGVADLVLACSRHKSVLPAVTGENSVDRSS